MAGDAQRDEAIDPAGEDETSAAGEQAKATERATHSTPVGWRAVLLTDCETMVLREEE